MIKRLLSAVIILISTTAFAQKSEAPKYVPTKKLVFLKPWFGQSSWYGSQWNGKKTACGIKYDSEMLYAAHPILPCGTWVRVTNVRTGHSEFAKIVDRGPYEEGREIDVSERVARRIDIKHYGVERVKLEVVRIAENRP